MKSNLLPILATLIYRLRALRGFHVAARPALRRCVLLMQASFVYLALNLAPQPVQAETLTFDDLDTSWGAVAVPAVYHGLKWQGFGAVDATKYITDPPSNPDISTSGYMSGRVSLPNVAYIAGNIFGYPEQKIMAVSGTFNLESLYLTSAWHNGLTVAFLAYDQVNGVWQERTVVVDRAAPPTFVNLNFNHVSTVYVTSSGGTNPHPTQTHNYAPNAVIDNLTFALNTDITVTGRVLDRSKDAPLNQATVYLAGRTTTTGSDGAFTLDHVDLAVSSILTASKQSYVPQTTTVSAGSSKKVDIGDISLPLQTVKPVVEWMKPDLAGWYLPGVGLVFKGKARVNWSPDAAHPNQPANVRFYANDQLVDTQAGAGPDYTATFSVDELFVPSLVRHANQVKVVATSVNGVESEEFISDVIVLPVPDSLEVALGDSANIHVEGDEVSIDVTFPEEPLSKTISLPFLGRFGAEFQGHGEFTYSIKSGAWNLTLGGEGSKAELLLGSFEAGTMTEISGKGIATPSAGITLQSVSLSPSLSLAGEFPLGSYGILDLCGPGVTTALSRVPALEKVLRPLSIELMLKPVVEGTADFDLYPAFAFKSLEFTGTAGLEASYEAEILGQTINLYVGGEPRMGFQVTRPPSDLFKEIGFRAYAGFEVKAWVLTASSKYVFVDFAYPSPGAAGLNPPTAGALGKVLEGAENKEEGWKPMARPWRAAGPERFLAGESGGETGVLLLSQALTALDAFWRMGLPPATSGTQNKDGGPVTNLVVSDSNLPAQAELPLIANVFPDSDPALATKDGKLMLLYVRDSGAANPVQFTEIGFSYYDETNWSTPSSLANVPNGQFAPQVAFDGNGDALAVWEQIKDAAFSGDDLNLMAAQMEIVCSKWDAVTGVWSAPVPVTNNAYLDHGPKLAGPLSNGDLMLTWTQNEGNLLMGEGVAGAATNSRVMTTRWNASARTWGPAAILVSDLIAEQSESLAAAGNTAVFAWTKDLDGNLDDLSDTELFYRTYDSALEVWGPETRLTDDAVADKNARVAVAANNNKYLIWQHGTDLVMDRDLAGAPSVIRTDTGTLGFADFAVTVGPNGNVMVLWQQVNEAGSDAYHRVFDPLWNVWGLDTALSSDSDLERSFAPVWDSTGNLVLAYNNVVVTRETKNVPVEGGGVVTVEGVPTPGEVSLHLARRTLVTDISLSPGGVSVERKNYLPGDVVPVKVHIRNNGSLAAIFEVALYDGDPAAGGVLVGSQSVLVLDPLLPFNPSPLRASEETDITFNWTVPQPAMARTLYVVIDPFGALSESDVTNNTGHVAINGMDLKVSYESSSVLRDGSARVVAKVLNLGAPSSPASVLRLWPQVNPGAQPIGAVNIEALAPGSSVEVPIDLPPGSQGPGDRTYRLVMDGAELAGDIAPDNNEALFSLSLEPTPRIDIFNGMSTNNADERLDDIGAFGFGVVQVGSSSSAQTFTILNGGVANLNDLAVSITGSGDFSFTQPALTSLAPNASTTFTVTFSPTAGGARNAVVWIASNDANQSPFHIALTGTGFIPGNDDANLANLILSSGALTPVFTAATTNYTANVPYPISSITVTPTTADVGAIVKVNNVTVTSGSASGPISLNIGSNTITAIVIAADGTTMKTYTAVVTRAPATPGDVEIGYDPNVVGSGVYATAVQPDGKTIIAGSFNSVLGVLRNNIARLNADGSLDTGFNPKANTSVRSVAVQADGKILLGGDYTTLQPNGAASATARQRIARVNADGSLDTGFDPKANSGVNSVALQTDGKVLLGGGFSTLQPNGAASATVRNKIARLNADGSLDTGFDPKANGTVYSLAAQPDGKILLGGQFSTLQPNGAANATSRWSVARVNADGSLDTGFDPKANSDVNSVALQADGSILLGGSFTTLQPNGAASATARQRIARVNADGSLDTGFVPNANDSVNSVAVQADGKILVVGSFTTLQPNGAASATTRRRIARVNADGSLDTGFDPNANQFLYSVALQADGKILLGGVFTTLQPNGAAIATARNIFARLNNDTAIQNLIAPNASKVQWQRGGSAPEVSQVTFELSIDGGANWTALGIGTRVGTSSDWQLTGLSLLSSGQLRARGRTMGGYYCGSSGLIETVATFGIGLTSSEIWRNQYFGTTSNTGDAADAADPDHDGLVNFLEFATNTNPTSASPVPGQALLNANNIEFTYVRSKAAMNHGVTFTVEWSDTLQAGIWSNTSVSETILSQDSTVQNIKAILPAGTNGRRFVHLKVTGP